MKKVALTTWWNYHNYGTALQVVALYNTIKNFGYGVDVVNYIPSGKKYLSDDELRLDIEKYEANERVQDNSRDEKFDDFLLKHLTFTKRCDDDDDFASLDDEYDAFVTGSDQIWSPIIFDERYFLNYARDNRKKISYAPSFGVEKIANDQIKQKIGELLSLFAHISTREKTGCKIIKNLLGSDRPVEMVLDPTLLLNYDDWRSIIARPQKARPQKYILAYFLETNDNAWNHVKAIAKRTSLPVEIVPIFTKDEKFGKFNYGVGLEEFFNLIDGAEIVLTDSYHGAIFSVICKKPFYVFERFSADDKASTNSRVYNLLEMLSLKNRLIKYDEPIRAEYDFKVNFKEPQKIVAAEKEKSSKYLELSLNIKSPLVSVIVPVYSVEKYIRRCLDSIKNQTYKNIEVIVIDDGTPDNSGKIADEFARKDNRFKVIHQKNCGVSCAKNVGMDDARGKYVVFVDADDAAAPDYVEYLLGLIENTNANVGCSLSTYNENTLDQIDTDYFLAYTPTRALVGIYTYGIGVAMWNKIFRRDFIEKNKLRVHEELWFSEGMTFCVEAFTLAEKIGVGRRRIYYQEYNDESATRKFNLESWKCGERGLAMQKKFWSKKIHSQKVRDAWNFHWWWGQCSALRKIYLAGVDSEYSNDVEQYIKNIRNKSHYAFAIPISNEQKLLYERIVKDPRKWLLSINIEESSGNKPTKLPWELNKFSLENEKLCVENLRLNAELSNFLSIKRSARLLAGNIKRRIKYGKKRNG
jgi:glycosyltransferase involved in cell wall biosynthesis